ncbi:MAG TPA: hypothetical protein VFX44_11485 [Solirubrobacterales bacterium]|nr:hypothetical protein [Solirubrobacterales bacterium]
MRLGRRWLGVVLAGCCACAVLAPSAWGWEYVTGPPKTETVHWQLASFAAKPPPPPGKRSVWIEVSTGYCVGEEPPSIHRVKIVERPRHRSIITAFLRFPAPVEVSGNVEAGEPVPACAGVGLSLFRLVKLRRPKQDLTLFDGSFSPPRKVHSFKP